MTLAHAHWGTSGQGNHLGPGATRKLQSRRHANTHTSVRTHEPTHLGKELLEVVKNGAGLLGEASQGGVVAHGTQRLLALRHHGLHQHVDVLDSPPERRQPPVKEDLDVVHRRGDGPDVRGVELLDEVGQVQRLLVQPLPALGVCVCVCVCVCVSARVRVCVSV